MVRVSRLEKRVVQLMPISRFDAGPAARLSSLLMAIVVTIFFGIAAIAQTRSDDTSTPGQPRSEVIADIVKGLKQAEQSIESLVVNHSYVSQHNFTEPGQPPRAEFPIEDNAVSMRRRGTVFWEIERDGRGRMEAKYLKTSSQFDQSQVKKREAYISTFDGHSGQFLTTRSTESGVVVSSDRRRTDRLMLISSSPFDFATHHHGKPISDLLAQPGAKIVGREHWEERPVVVVEALPVTVRDDYIYRQRF